tara:strand:- start:34 stop:615 length:582 start_codon:yes stop_codon:yes gene_type:complete
LSFLIYDFFLKELGGGGVSFSSYRGNVLLIVNVASHCGFTPQYKHLQKLHEKLSGKNFSVLAFPCNDFSNQEPGSENKILEFCGGVYGVTFDIFEKVKVRGVDTHHLYRYLESEFSPVIRPKGFKAKLFQLFTLIHFLIKERRFPHAGEVMWNFHKFVIGRNGQVAGHFSSDCDPFDPRLVACIERELKEKTN